MSEARGTGVRGEVSTEKKTLQGEMRVASLQVFSKSRECVITLRLFFNSKFCFILAEKGRNVWRLLKEVGLGEGFYEKLATVSVRSPVTLVISFVRRTSFLSRTHPLIAFECCSCECDGIFFSELDRNCYCEGK